MAQLKDTIVSGNLRVTDTTLTDTLQVTIIKAPTSSGGTTYGPGTSGQILKSNGTMTYWADMPTIPTVNNASLTLKGAGTTVTTFTANSSTNQSLDIVAGSNVTITPDATNHKITITSSYTNTDTKVKVTANTTTKGYLIASTTSPNGTAVEGIADTGVYLGTTAGSLYATSFYENGTALSSKYYGSTISRVANTVLAAPDGSDGTASFRKLVAADLPDHTHSYLPLSGGTMTGAIAYNNATTRLNSLKNLTNDNVGTSATYFLTITNSWGKGGYTSVADAKNVLGLKSAAYTASTDYLSSSTKYAGSSSAGGAATSANKLNTNDGSTNRPVYFSGGVPVQCATPASSSWFKGVPLIGTDGVMEIGKIIDFHATNASTADYDYRMGTSTTAMELTAGGSSNTLTIKSSGNTQLSFQTTSSGKVYTAPGITCYPLTDTGMTSLFNFGGNLVIGGGESAKTLYDNNYDTIKTVENEDLYLCADHDIHIVTGCQTYADKSIIEIDAIGKVYLPSTGGIIVKQRSDSNYVSATAWWNGGTAPNSGEYAPQIGQHNTGGDSSYPGSICILPYKTTTNPWGGVVGLFIKKDHVYIDGVELSKSGHTHSYIPLSGSTSVTGKIGFSAINTGIWLKDASGIQVGALVDNGSNLWIGAGQSTLRHHKGETFISSGWSGTLPTTASSSLTGNQTIKISVPVYTVDANGNGSWNHTGYPVLHSGNYTSYALASTTKYAGSTSVGGAANSANVLNKNTRMDYGWDGVNYFNINGTAGNAAKVNDTPTTAWWHIMRFNNYNTSGYYTDLAIPFGTTSLYYKRITGGSVQNGGWVKVLDALNVGYVMSSVIKYDSHARRFTSSKTDSAWNAQAYSNTGYADNVYVSFRAGQTTMYAMIGLDANPSEDANYDKIDYCWYIQNNGALKVYESGTAVTITGHTTYASGDEFRVEYSCGEIRYYHNGTMCRAVTRAVSGKLFFDSSFHNAGNVYDFSYGTSTHSTHTAQIITSTYKSSSYVTSLTSSVITLSDAASSFGGWICGPTKNGRIVISSYQGDNDKLYFGYGERGRTANSYVKAMTWDGPTNTLTADKFVGALQGNATTSSSWATARTLTLGGQLAGSVSVKGDANMTLKGYLDRAFIYDDNAVPKNHTWAEYAWHKFAEVTIATTWTDCVITFLVSRTYSSSAENAGILSAKLRTKGSKDYDSAQLKWLVRNSGLSKDDFVMVYTSTSGTSTKAELWCRLPEQYSGLIFTVLKGHKRQYSTDTSWTLVKTPDESGSTHGSSSYPTTGITGTIISSDGTITNSTTGTANRATYLDVVSSNEIRFYNDNQLKANNQFWIGYSWAAGSHYTPSGGSDTSSTTAPNITKFIMGNCSAGGLASVHAKTFILGNGSSPTHTSKTTTIATAATTTDRTITLPDASGNVILGTKGSTSFWGLMDGAGSISEWIRATSSGFIPSQGAKFFQTATSSLGTNTWYFKNSYIQYMNANSLILGAAKTADGAAKGQMKFFSGNANDTTGTVTLECVNDSARTGDYTVKLPTWNGTIPVFEKLFEGASNNVSLSFSDINEYDLFLITVANSNATTEQVTVASLWISNIAGVHDMPLIWGGTPSSSGGACNVTSGWIQLTKNSGTTTFVVAHKSKVAQMTNSGWSISSPTYNLYIRKIFGLKAYKRT